VKVSPLKSVDTPVAKSPRDATASEPPRSTMHARVPPWRMLRRFYRGSGISNGSLGVDGEVS
jgi:hypothetical protein